MSKPEEKPAFDSPLLNMTVKERTTLIDPKVTRARRRWQVLGVIIMGVCGVFFVNIDRLLGLKPEKIVHARMAEATAKIWEPGVAIPMQPPPVKPKKPRPAPIVDPEALGALQLEPTDIPAEKEWPVQVSLPGPPEIKIVDDQTPKEFVYRSPHYEFRSDTKLGPDVVREFARVFEATHLAVCKLPLDFRPTPETMKSQFTARLFEGEQEYREAGGMAGSAGCYKRSEKALFVPLNSLGVKVLDGGRTLLDRGGAANSTLIHEITHQMMNRWLPRLPIWYIEGVAEYMVVPEYLHGRFNFSQLDMQLRQYLKRRGSRDGSFAMLKPGELMALDPRVWSQTLAGGSVDTRQNYVSAVLLAFYFHHLDARGEAITAYLRAIEKGGLEIDACRDHLIRDRTFEAIESDLRSAYRKLNIDVTFVSRGGPVWEPAEEEAETQEAKSPPTKPAPTQGEMREAR